MAPTPHLPSTQPTPAIDRARPRQLPDLGWLEPPLSRRILAVLGLGLIAERTRPPTKDLAALARRTDLVERHVQLHDRRQSIHLGRLRARDSISSTELPV